VDKSAFIKPYRGRKRPPCEPAGEDQPNDELLQRVRVLVAANERSHRQRRPISLPKLKLLDR
jgi:hypothetical protein